MASSARRGAATCPKCGACRHGGIELQGWFREICSDLAVIAVTGYPPEPKAASAPRLRAFAQLTKPVGLGELSGLATPAIE